MGKAGLICPAMKTDIEVLDALSSKHKTEKKVADLLGLGSGQALHWWRVRPGGIPWEHRNNVFLLARRSGVRLSRDWINANLKPLPPPRSTRRRRKPKPVKKPR